MARRTAHVTGAAWSRRRIQVLLAAAALTVVALVTAVVMSIVQMVLPSAAAPAPDERASSHKNPTAHPQATVAARDELSNRPMQEVDESASRPGPVSALDPGMSIELPLPTTTGPAGVPTGYPQTPEGSLAQLAAIDQAAFQSGSLAGAREVIRAWALPGGPTTTSWSVVHALAALFDSTGVSGGGSARLAIVLTPLMGLIKGAVGTDFVVPCVDFELDVTLEQTARGAVADCQRMVWTADRWLIGPGDEPAHAPSVWPDTDIAISVGYRDLSRG